MQGAFDRPYKAVADSLHVTALRLPRSPGQQHCRHPCLREGRSSPGRYLPPHGLLARPARRRNHHGRHLGGVRRTTTGRSCRSRHQTASGVTSTSWAALNSVRPASELRVPWYDLELCPPDDVELLSPPMVHVTRGRPAPMALDPRGASEKTARAGPSIPHWLTARRSSPRTDVRASCVHNVVGQQAPHAPTSQSRIPARRVTPGA